MEVFTLIKINGGVECRWCMKKIAIVDECLVDHCWMVTCDHHLDGSL